MCLLEQSIPVIRLLIISFLVQLLRNTRSDMQVSHVFMGAIYTDYTVWYVVSSHDIL